MARFINKNLRDIGVSPDKIFFRGKQKAEHILLRLIDFDATNLEERPVETVNEVLSYQERDTVTWFNIDGLHNEVLMEEISEGFDIDRMVLAEVMDTQARPRVNEYNNCIFISLKMLRADEQGDQIIVENLSLIITTNVLMTFQERRGDVFEPVRERIRQQKKRIRNSGVDYLACALMDIVIDNYLYIVSMIGDRVEELEEAVLSNPDKSVIEDINAYKRELNLMRKNIIPAKEMLIGLSKMESDFIKNKNHVHYKNLLDNINQAIDSSDSYRDILSDQLNIYHTTISSKLNDIMKFLTIFSVIFIPLTFIAGIYGTNFDFIPELRYRYSYFIMLGTMVVMALGMLYYFRVKKWF